MICPGKRRLCWTRKFTAFATILSIVSMKEELWEKSVDCLFQDLRFDFCESQLQCNLASVRPWCSQNRAFNNFDRIASIPTRTIFCLIVSAPVKLLLFFNLLASLFPLSYYHFRCLYIFHCSAQHLYASSSFWIYSNETFWLPKLWQKAFFLQ